MALQLWVAAVAIAVAGCAAGEEVASPEAKVLIGASSLQYVDLTDDFDRAWSATADLPDDERTGAFKQRFAGILAGFYDEKRFNDEAEDYDQRLLTKMKAYPERRQGIADVASRFATLFSHAVRSFEKSFGPMTDYPPVYLVNSLGEFDGGTRDLPEGTRLLFGADVIDKLYQSTSIEPFFHHELFHVFHHRTFGECETGYCPVWTEGLAVYVAARLNPEANDAALGLTLPAPIRERVDAHLAEAVCSVRVRLDSTDFEDYRALFMGDGTPPSANLPERYAYYVGYLVARDLGRTRSLTELAGLQPTQVRPLIEQSLAGMAICA